MQLSKYVDLTAIHYSSSSPAICADCANASGVMFIAVPGTTVARTAEMSLKLGATTTGLVACSSAHYLSSTGATRDVLILDVYRPTKRYVECTYAATADMEARMLAFTYGLREPPVSFSATAVTNLTVPVVAGGVKRVVSPTST